MRLQLVDEAAGLTGRPSLFRCLSQIKPVGVNLVSLSPPLSSDFVSSGEAAVGIPALQHAEG